MSEKWAKLPQALILDRRVSDGAMRLWGRLYHHEYGRGRWGKALPTRKALAEELGRGGSTVGNQLAELERYGWVTIYRQGNGQRWDRIETHMVSQNPGAPVISNPGAPTPEDEPESWRIPVEEFEVPPAETAAPSRIYSGPAPKNEGLGLIPRGSTSEPVASADTEGAPTDGAPEAGDWKCAHPTRCPCGGDPRKDMDCLFFYEDRGHSAPSPESFLECGSKWCSGADCSACAERQELIGPLLQSRPSNVRTLRSA